ncbi:MAG: hypothetical protein GTO08_03180, partial [Deltaproteobacteria bacterium]|nr:hypothetical protein [Deltaproteobacteria bacterium]
NEYGPRANDGCPYGDYDGDGLTDDIDECLDQAGPIENNGCPTTDCDDSDPCTIDSYDSSTGRCKNVPKDCDDGDPCTFDGCDRTTGGCVYVTMVCGDDDPCTLDSCDRGECVHMKRDCSDGDPNTYDYCEPSTGNCSHVTLADKCALMNLSIEGAVINELSRNMKLFVDYRGNFDQQLGAYLEYSGTNYAWFFDAKANEVTEVTIPEEIILVGGAGPDPLKEVSKVTVISPQCQDVSDSVDMPWITKKSQYCRYAEASIVGARYDASDELVLSVNNSGDVDLNFVAYLQYAGDGITYAWYFKAGESTVTDVTMSEMFRDFKPLELIGREVSWVTVTGVDCPVGEYRFEGPDIAG